MSQLSVENIRKLNRAHLLAIEVPLPSGENWGETDSNSDSAVKGVPAGKAPWHVSLYTSSGISLSGNVEASSPFADILGNITRNKVVSTIAHIAGLSPQFDFSQKYMFMGTQPLSFSIQGALILENDPVTDYLIPLKRLSYLTYPSRATPLTLDGVFDSINKAIIAMGKDQTKFGQTVMGLRDNLGSVVNFVVGGLSVDTANQSGKDGWEQIKDFMGRTLGSLYPLIPPPTFDWERSGSGLDFKYGTTLISDVFIKSLKVDIPTLYYEGGWPPYMTVSLELGTFRNITYDLFNDILQGMPQSWDALNNEALKRHETLKARYSTNTMRAAAVKAIGKALKK